MLIRFTFVLWPCYTHTIVFIMLFAIYSHNNVLIVVNMFRGVIFVQLILYNSCDDYFSFLLIGQKQWRRKMMRENKSTCEYEK